MSCQVILNTEQIGELIPHRDPFLFINEAHVVNSCSIEGVAHWPAGHPILSGHFPGLPMVPAVCQIEALAQLAGVLLGMRTKANGSDLPHRVGLMGAVRSASFHSPVRPDQSVGMACSLRDISERAILVEGVGRIGTNLVLKSQFLIFMETVVNLRLTE